MRSRSKCKPANRILHCIPYLFRIRAGIFIFSFLTLLPGNTVAQANEQTDTVRLIITDFSCSPDAADGIECGQMADLFIGELDEFFTSVLSMDDRNRRLEIIPILRIQSSDSTSHDYSPFPKYYGKIVISGSSVSADIRTLLTENTITGENLPRKGKLRRDVERLARAIGRKLIEIRVGHAIDDLSYITVQLPKGGQWAIPDMIETRRPSTLLSVRAHKGRPYIINAIHEGDTTPITSATVIYPGVIQTFRIVYRNNHYLLVPKRIRLAFSTALGFTQNEPVFSAGGSARYLFAGKWSFGLGLRYLRIPETTRIRPLPDQWAQSIVRRANAWVPTISVDYQHFDANLALAYGIEAGVYPLHMGGYARVFVTPQKLPWLRFGISYHNLAIAITERTFDALGLNAATSQKTVRYGMPTLGLQTLFTF